MCVVLLFSSMGLVMEQLQIEDSTKSMSTNHQSYNGQALESGSGAGQGVPVKHGEECNDDISFRACGDE